jgi:hypothetical protein
MRAYTPDVWVVLEFKTSTETIQKVFAGWYGGFAGSNSWQLNSGIKSVHKVGDSFEFEGYSGSIYRCKERNYHMSTLMLSVLGNWLKQADQRGIEIKVLELENIKVN